MEPGREVGGYVVEGLLGRTPWATTHAAILPPHRYVALKVLELDTEKDPETLAKLESTLVGLVDVAHPSVLGPIDAGEIDDIGAPFVVTPLAPHPSLADLVSTSPLAQEEVRDLLRQLGVALERAREAGISHLSLKPTNVFVGPPPSHAVAVVDFGMHVLRKEESPKDDVHGAALLACYALSGNQGAVEAVERNPDDLARTLGVAIDDELEAALALALRSGAADRFSTVTELAEAIQVDEPIAKAPSDRATARHSKASQLMPRFKMPEPEAERTAIPIQTKTVQMKAFATKQWTAFKPPNQTMKMEPFQVPLPAVAPKPTSAKDAPTVVTRRPSSGFAELARTRPMMMLGVSVGIAVFGILAAVFAIIKR